MPACLSVWAYAVFGAVASSYESITSMFSGARGQRWVKMKRSEGTRPSEMGVSRVRLYCRHLEPRPHGWLNINRCTTLLLHSTKARSLSLELPSSSTARLAIRTKTTWLTKHYTLHRTTVTGNHWPLEQGLLRGEQYIHLYSQAQAPSAELCST